MNYQIQKNFDENKKASESDEPVRLSIEHILGQLIILGFGYIAATICFLAEIWWWKNHQQN